MNNPAHSPFRTTVHLHASSEQRVVNAGRYRLVTIGVFFALCYLSLAVRLIDVSMGERSVMELFTEAAHDITYVKEETLTSVKMIRGEVQIEEEKEWQPNLTQVVMPRQSIRDRNGVLIASSVATRSIYARPREITDPEGVLRRLRQAVPDLNAELTLRRLQSSSKYVQLKRHLTPEEQEKLLWAGIAGVYFYDDYYRIYPHGHLFSHVLGWTDVDGKGIAGVERFFNANLTQNETLTPLTLSLDTRMQGVLYEVLSQSMQQFKAAAVAGAIFHIPTGEARAMVSLPDFDPNRPLQSTEDARRNRLSANQYELGSTFKTLSLAMAMQHGGLTIHDGFDASHPILFRGAKISDFHPKNRFLSVPEIMAYSSNIGTVKMVASVGAEKQRAFLNRLGMFGRVGIELQEYSVPHTSAVWKPVEAATISYGHGISVTPLHLIRAMVSVSGGGHFRDLTLLKGQKKEGDELVSGDVSRTVNRLMRAVVQHGTAKQADVKGYGVGAKTGTAIKVVNGRYDNSKNISSIVAAFPMQNPQFLIFVMLDEPHGTKETYGFATAGWVAAPAVAQIVKAIAPMAGLPPTYETPDDEVDHMILTAAARAKAGNLTHECHMSSVHLIDLLARVRGRNSPHEGELKRDSVLVGGNSAINPDISLITQDSRAVKQGSLFAAIVGSAVNGEAFIDAAVKTGAVAVLCRPEAAMLVPDGVAVLTHPEPRHALSLLAAAFYTPQPEHIVAITGTDGKTSTAEFARQWWELLGNPALSIGTLGLKSDRTLENLPPLSDNTTPEAVAFYQTLQLVAQQGVQHVACEASSHGLHQHRLDGIAPEVAVFTSFSQDHLDYHGTMEDYFEAKKALFSRLLAVDGTAILCSDYPEIAALAERLRAQGTKFITYGLEGDLTIQSITPSAQGQAVEIAYLGQQHRFAMPIFGAFQISNILAAALAVSVTTGVALADMLPLSHRLKPIRGRLELVTTTREGALIFVDYAHTAGALEKALLTLKPYVTGRLHLVFGCGGDRDTSKRPKMGTVAARLADNVIVTDDNPRTEDPLAIRQAVLAGCPDAAEVAGRAQAISLATRVLCAGDVLLIAGKGHEDYQIIGTVKHPFDDRTAVDEALRQEDA